jgi:hypothetical protein
MSREEYAAGEWAKERQAILFACRITACRIQNNIFSALE